MRFSGDPAYQAFRLLQAAFVIVPLLAGFDKFFYFMTNWSHYLAPFSHHLLRGHDRFFFTFVGLLEMIVGVGVFLKPAFFSYVVAVWLLCIIFNLLFAGHYLDIVLRDVGLMLSAVALAKLSEKYAK